MFFNIICKSKTLLRKCFIHKLMQYFFVHIISSIWASFGTVRRLLHDWQRKSYNKLGNKEGASFHLSKKQHHNLKFSEWHKKKSLLTLFCFHCETIHVCVLARNLSENTAMNKNGIKIGVFSSINPELILRWAMVIPAPCHKAIVTYQVLRWT